MQVEAVGSPRDGQQRATLAERAPRSDRPHPRRGHPPRLPGLMPGRHASRSKGPCARRPTRPYGAYLRRIGAHGTLRANTMTVEPSRRRSRACPRSVARGGRTGARGGPARTRGRAGRRDPDRPARPRRPRPGGSVHDRRRQPRRGDLRLEHRDRRRGGRRLRRPAGSPSPLRRHHRGDRRVRRVRRGVRVRRPGRPHGGRRAAGPRERPGGSGGHRTRLDGRRAVIRRPRARPRCRSPVVRARDGRADRLGDADRRGAGPDRAWPTARVAHREPRRLAGCPGGDTAAHPRVVRTTIARGACGQPARGPAGGAGDGGRVGGAGRWVTRRRGRTVGTSARSLPRPAWVLLRIAVSIVQSSARTAVRQRHAPPAP